MKAVADIFKEQVTPAYTKAMQDLAPLGLPEETLKGLAMRRADFAYKEALEVEELRHPGFGAAIGREHANRELMEKRFTKDEKRAVIDKYRDKKKARRAAK